MKIGNIKSKIDKLKVNEKKGVNRLYPQQLFHF
jgi:hypothetical protein